MAVTELALHRRHQKTVAQHIPKEPSSSVTSPTATTSDGPCVHDKLLLQVKQCIDQLPEANRYLLARLFKHLNEYVPYYIEIILHWLEVVAPASLLSLEMISQQCRAVEYFIKNYQSIFQDVQL
ncbi:hypothetical protein HELRODRAFT_168302 [Helobdella robusta]|uniref:Uncharacterized protein n=1 Tax=Helobdella robusta TaxID=6412 RepID=T1F0E9_HELRO|nr:hypothetical protein HELRODRAFT_168302 [Helobdella robusta]ESO09332.1 hypothetical protein HELRODRAFT_168302 [Helobdella robusta]